MIAMVKGPGELNSNGLSIVKVKLETNSYWLRDGKLFFTFTKAPTK